MFHSFSSYTLIMLLVFVCHYSLCFTLSISYIFYVSFFQFLISFTFHSYYLRPYAFSSYIFMFHSYYLRPYAFSSYIFYVSLLLLKTFIFLVTILKTYVKIVSLFFYFCRLFIHCFFSRCITYFIFLYSTMTVYVCEFDIHFGYFSIYNILY